MYTDLFPEVLLPAKVHARGLPITGSRASLTIVRDTKRTGRNSHVFAALCSDWRRLYAAARIAPHAPSSARTAQIGLCFRATTPLTKDRLCIDVPHQSRRCTRGWHTLRPSHRFQLYRYTKGAVSSLHRYIVLSHSPARPLALERSATAARLLYTMHAHAHEHLPPPPPTRAAEADLGAAAVERRRWARVRPGRGDPGEGEVRSRPRFRSPCRRCRWCSGTAAR